MRQQGSHGFACAVALCCGLCLSGCASLADMSAFAAKNPELAQIAGEFEQVHWTLDAAWSCDARDAFRWKLAGAPHAEQHATDPVQLKPLIHAPGRIGRTAAILIGRESKTPSPAVVAILAEIVTGEASGRRLRTLREVVADWGTPLDASEATDIAPTTNERAAAAEAWCHALAASDPAIDVALDRPARLWRRDDLPDEVRAELVRGLARHIAPERIVGFDELLPADPTTVSTSLRQAALEGCILFAVARQPREYSADVWPASIENARFDPDASLRRLYGRWLAAAGHPETITQLEAQLADTHPTVSLAAIQSLGAIRSDAARDALHRIAAKPAETLRNAAVDALAHWSRDEITPYLEDESPIVRRTAVACLGRWESPEAAVLLDSVLADADLDIQRRAVAATKSWSDEYAVPVLLSGLQSASVRTRRECLDELRRRTGFEEPFPITAEPEERAQAVADLCTAHGWSGDRLTAFRLATTKPAAPAAEPPPDVQATLQRLAAQDLESAIRDALLKSLRESGPGAVPAIEAFCLDHAGRTADLITAEVLPHLAPAHAALNELARDDVAVRRHGISRLAELGRSATLTPFVLQRLHSLLTHEQDGLVWRQAMAAIAADATPGAEAIALLAANNSWPDVRRLGCEYAGRHCRAEHAAWLLPLLSDGNDAVRLAAIDAAGRCANSVAIGSESGPSGSPTGLRAAAADPNRTIRFAALVALARLGDEAGSLALLRWAEYELPAERTKAIRAIAETGRRRFEHDLMRLAWTERDESVQRELLAALEAIVPPSQRPEGALAIGAEDRLAAWAARWEAVGGSSTMAAVPADP